LHAPSQVQLFFIPTTSVQAFPIFSSRKAHRGGTKYWEAKTPEGVLTGSTLEQSGKVLRRST
jgi:hypothetical protein